MENIAKILNVMEMVADGAPPEKLLPLLPYEKADMADYYANIAPNDEMGFFLLQLENWFYSHEDAVERENPRVSEYWRGMWAYPLFEKTEPAFYYDEPERWQDFLHELRAFVAQTKKIL